MGIIDGGMRTGLARSGGGYVVGTAAAGDSLVVGWYRGNGIVIFAVWRHGAQNRLRLDASGVAMWRESDVDVGKLACGWQHSRASRRSGQGGPRAYAKGGGGRAEGRCCVRTR